MLPIGLQLYSVRDEMEKDFAGTLKKVADMGYDGVEFAGLFGRGADEIKAMLAENGLKGVGSCAACRNARRYGQGYCDL